MNTDNQIKDANLVDEQNRRSLYAKIDEQLQSRLVQCRLEMDAAWNEYKKTVSESQRQFAKKHFCEGFIRAFNQK